MPPTFGYIASPPINNVTQPLNLSTQETAFNAEIHDHYTPVDRVNDLVKKLDEANQTVQKQREKNHRHLHLPRTPTGRPRW